MNANSSPKLLDDSKLLDDVAFLDEVEGIGQLVISLLEGVHTKPDNISGQVAGLACTVAELFVASVAVLRSPAPSHAMTLARSMVDGYADLCALLNDSSHLERMELAAARNLVQVFEGFMADPATRDDVLPHYRGEVKRARRRMEELQRKGVETDTGKDKFRGELRQLYTTFQFLCASTHNDLNTLAARHVRPDGLAIYEPMSRGTLKSMAGILLGILFQAIAKMPEVANLDRDRMKQTMDALDRRWAAAADRFVAPPAEVAAIAE